MERAMSMKDAVISFWVNGFKFNGRSRRREYWLSGLGHLLIFLLVGAIFLILDIITQEKFNLSDIYNFIIGDLFYWVAFIPGMALGCRRLQDINVNGIYCIIFSVLSIPLTILGYFYSDEQLFLFNGPLAISILVLNVLIIIFAIVLFIMACIEGTRGPNKYGEDPKYID